MVQALTSIKNTWSARANSTICPSNSKERKASKDHCNAENLRTPKSSYLASFKSRLQGAVFPFPNLTFVILENNPTTVSNRLLDTYSFYLHILLSRFNPKVHKCLQPKENTHRLKKNQTIGFGLKNFWLASGVRQPWCLFPSCRPGLIVHKSQYLGFYSNKPSLVLF